MSQYESYPIYINVPPQHLKEEREKQIAHFASKKDFRKTAWLRNARKRLDEITINPNPTAFDIAFEKEVIKDLNLIRSTPIGRVTLDSLNRNEKIWILPLSDEERVTDCENCAAYVFPAKPEEGGGIRLYYSPQRDVRGRTWVITSDGTFFHEIVHALRFGWSGSWEKTHWIEGYKDQEEFIATMMENLYLSSRGKREFLSNYLNPKMLGKTQLYELYANDANIISWLKRCVTGDAFLWAMARRADPPFNPWRDHPHLEKKWLQKAKSRGVSRFPG